MKSVGRKLFKAYLNGEGGSSSSEDDEGAELLSDEIEKGFYKVLSRLKKKDAKLYEENVTYFSVEDSKNDEQKNIDKEKRKGKKRLEDDYKKWLRGQKLEVEDEEVKRDLEALHDFWVNPDLCQEDQFLRDYILNKKFLEKDNGFSLEKELEKLSEEEKEVQEQSIYEYKYNTRFENPDQSFLKENPKSTEKTFRKKKRCYRVRDTIEKIEKGKQPGKGGKLVMDEEPSAKESLAVPAGRTKQPRRKGKYCQNKWEISASTKTSKNMTVKEPKINSKWKTTDKSRKNQKFELIKARINQLSRLKRDNPVETTEVEKVYLKGKSTSGLQRKGGILKKKKPRHRNRKFLK